MVRVRVSSTIRISVSFITLYSFNVFGLRRLKECKTAVQESFLALRLGFLLPDYRNFFLMTDFLTVFMKFRHIRS